ncbi:uncharacterized protein SCODWIG_02980 [Saccharomycodes ludwigii]|uniref:Uncharacterized protein n=2 Tax=Saccharomycodes ludwigii TaxID=36035 RepID=A0A376B9H9_9ASCO|nr:uncharacterized protein SCODWIG_02980 [Saccharomycodes ludwigii]
MPLNIIGTIAFEGTDKIPYFQQMKTAFPYLLGVGLAKYFFIGSKNIWERNLHGKVYILTGATSMGMGTNVATELASRGAQLILLTRRIDEWSEEFLEDLRKRTDNELIYWEQCDMSNLYSVRKFATKWLDNSPPRRLDGIILMHGDAEPWFNSKTRKSSVDGLEIQISTNFAGSFHLLDILQPAFRSQPPDREVRIIVTTCLLQSLGEVNVDDPLWSNQKFDGSLKYLSASRIQLSLCCLELQRRLNLNKKEDTGQVTVSLVNPGIMRSYSLRRIISNGSILLLILLYCIILYPFLWIFTKSGYRGSQSILHALMTPELESINLKRSTMNKNKDKENLVVESGFISDCKFRKFARKEFQDEELQKKLYDKTKHDIFELEKVLAVRRNREKKNDDTTKKKTKSKNKKD